MITIGANPITIDELKQYIGKKCRKARYNKAGDLLSPKPFKSRKQVNVIKDVITHPVLQIPSFTFEDDDSFVEARRIIILEE